MTNYTIEAEDMQLTGYIPVTGKLGVSGGGYVEAAVIVTDDDTPPPPAVASTVFNGDAGTYRLDLSLFDEPGGSSTVEVYINGVRVSLLVLDQDTDSANLDDGPTRFSLLDLELEPGDTIEIVSYADKTERAVFDKLDLTLIEPVGPQQLGDVVTLLYEDFSSPTTVAKSDMHLGASYAATNAAWDGALNFNTVDLDGYTNGQITFKAGISRGAFELWGQQYGDMFSVELIDQNGTVHVLDVFAGVGDMMTGATSGQVLEGTGWKTLTYDVPRGITSFELSIQSKLSSTCEILVFDDVKITAQELLSPYVDAVDDAITVLETEGAGETDLNVLDNDAASDGTAGPVLRVEGQEANVGQWIDLAGGGRVRIDANGALDFDADGDFDFLNNDERDQVQVTYTVAELGDVNGQQVVLAEDTATVTITILGVEPNSAPVAVNDAIAIDENETVTPGGANQLNVLANDSDPDGDPLTVTTVNGLAVAPGGAVTTTATTVNGVTVDVTVGADGEVTFDTAGAFDDLNLGESDSFTIPYTAADGNGGQDDATITITINGLDGDVVQPVVSYNIVFLVDSSSSVLAPSADGAAIIGSDPRDDLNGDGNADAQIDAELLIVQRINDVYGAANLSDDFDVGVFTFSTNPGFGVANRPSVQLSEGGQDVFDAGQDLTGAFNGAGGGGIAAYNTAIASANFFFKENTPDDASTVVNLVYVISDGAGFDWTFGGDPSLGAELSALNGNYGAKLETIAIDNGGANSPLFQQMEAASGDGVIQVVDTEWALQSYLDSLSASMTAPIG